MLTNSNRKFKFPKRDLPKLLNRFPNFGLLIFQCNFTQRHASEEAYVFNSLDSY